ncbi:hypothetical protein [Streptomyces xiamenensis]
METAIEAFEPPFDAVLCDLDGVIRFYDTAEVTRLGSVAKVDLVRS